MNRRGFLAAVTGCTVAKPMAPPLIVNMPPSTRFSPGDTISIVFVSMNGLKMLDSKTNDLPDL